VLPDGMPGTPEELEIKCPRRASPMTKPWDGLPNTPQSQRNTLQLYAESVGVPIGEHAFNHDAAVYRPSKRTMS
jgi:hypothetical protein